MEFDSARFRQVLGQYPTGVVVVTAMDAAGQPIGMTVGSFTSVSLDPPLVAFLPDRQSSSWHALRASGPRFCVNILAAYQEEVCRQIAMRKTDKFEGIAWRQSPAGNPVIEGAVAYLECTVDVIHDAGDHDIVIGLVHALALEGTGNPLLFFRGGYGSFTPLTLASNDADLLHMLHQIDLVRPMMEALSEEFDSEVIANCRVRDQVVIAASAGRSRIEVAPTRVGLRSPFAPPLGLVFAAFGDEQLRRTWLAALPETTTEEHRRVIGELPDRIREQGYALVVGHARGADRDRFMYGHQSVQPNEPLPHPSEDILDMAVYHPNAWNGSDDVELRAIIAPVFGTNSEVAFSLSLFGPPGRVGPTEVREHVAQLLHTAHEATREIATARWELRGQNPFA